MNEPNQIFTEILETRKTLEELRDAKCEEIKHHADPQNVTPAMEERMVAINNTITLLSAKIHRLDAKIHSSTLKRRRIIRRTNKEPISPKRFFTVLELFSYILPTVIKTTAFEPAFYDLKSDYLKSRHYKSKGQIKWLWFCFAFKSLAMIVNCLFLASGDKGKRALLHFLPEPVRKFWRS